MILVGFALVWCTLYVSGAAVPTAARGAFALAATLAVAVAVTAVLHRVPLRRIPAELGLGRPTGRAMAVAVVVSALCLSVYPIFTLVTGHPVSLRADWPSVLVGVLVYHGVAEELAWRGYTFGRLRRGRTFRRAVLLTMPLLVLTHVPVIVEAGPAVGAAAMAVAAVTTLPLSHLYEQGGRTIWAPALVHAAIDSFKLVTVPAAAAATFPLALAVMAVVVPLLALVLIRKRHNVPEVVARDRA